MGVIAGLYLFLVLLYKVDLFEFLTGVVHKFLKTSEPYEVDELIPGLLLVSAGIYGDLLRQRRRARHHQEFSAQRLEAMASAMGEVQDVVNNFLNNMQLFRFEAERSGALGEEHL